MNHYQIIYNSIILTVDKQVAVEEFARLFCMSPDKAAAILAKPKTVLRSHLDSATAEIYREKLIAIGLDVEVNDVSMQKQKPVIFRALEEETDIAATTLELAPLEMIESGSGRVAGYRGNRILGFDFYGSGAGYFRVWLSNVVLCLLTLGIYFPWASVRTRQYFYSQTELEGASFQCVAKPVQLLQLWIVLAGWLFLYAGFRYVPGVDARASVFMLLVLPAIAVWFFSKQLTAIAWRNVAIGFECDYMAAYQIMVPPLLLSGLLLLNLSKQISAIASLVLLAGFPYWSFSLNRFRINRASFAGRHFQYGSGVFSYYALYFFKLPLLVLMVGLLICAMLFAALGGSLMEQLHSMEALVLAPRNIAHMQSQSSHYIAALLVALSVSITGTVWLFAYLKSCLFNLRYEGSFLDKNVMSSSMTAWPLLWLYLGNTVAIVLSAGLLVPWATVRLWQYRLSCLTLHASYDLDDIVGKA